MPFSCSTLPLPILIQHLTIKYFVLTSVDNGLATCYSWTLEMYKRMEHNMWDYVEQAGKQKRRAHYRLQVADNSKLSISSADSNLLMPVGDSLELSFATQTMSPKLLLLLFISHIPLFFLLELSFAVWQITCFLDSMDPALPYSLPHTGPVFLQLCLIRWEFSPECSFVVSLDTFGFPPLPGYGWKQKNCDS